MCDKAFQRDLDMVKREGERFRKIAEESDLDWAIAAREIRKVRRA